MQAQPMRREDWKVYNFKQLQEEISKLSEDDQVVISLNVFREGRIDSFSASNKFPVEDYKIAREHISEQLHQMREIEYSNTYKDVDDSEKVNDEAARIQNLLE